MESTAALRCWLQKKKAWDSFQAALQAVTSMQGLYAEHTGLCKSNTLLNVIKMT